MCCQSHDSYMRFPLSRMPVPAVLASYGCCNKLPPTKCLKTTYFYFLAVLEVKSLNLTQVETKVSAEPCSLRNLWGRIQLSIPVSRATFFAFLGSKFLPLSSKPTAKVASLSPSLLPLLHLPLSPSYKGICDCMWAPTRIISDNLSHLKVLNDTCNIPDSCHIR